jgi:ketosteroid isomerase-like protein
MRSRKDTVKSYFEGFRRGDHEAILRLLTDDVGWDIYGHRHLQGTKAFDAEIENDAFEGNPDLTLSDLIAEDDKVVAPHIGEVRRRGGGSMKFAACDVFTFDGALISRVESYVVPIH